MDTRNEPAREPFPRGAVRLLYIRKSRVGSDWNEVPHTHACSEMFYCIRGQGRINIGGKLHKVEPDDLVKFGLIPELVGRLPVVTVLDPLDEDALVRVLKEPKNSVIKQYQTLMDMDNVDLEFTDEALRAVAQKTIERKSGARGLRSVMVTLTMVGSLGT